MIDEVDADPHRMAVNADGWPARDSLVEAQSLFQFFSLESPVHEGVKSVALEVVDGARD